MKQGISPGQGMARCPRVDLEVEVAHSEPILDGHQESEIEDLRLFRTNHGSSDMDSREQSDVEAGISAFSAAKKLYGSAFEAQDGDSVIASMHEWRTISSTDRDFISNHLQYLNLRSQNANSLLLRRLLRELEEFSATVETTFEDALDVLDNLEAAMTSRSDSRGEAGDQESWMDAERATHESAEAAPAAPSASPAHAADTASPSLQEAFEVVDAADLNLEVLDEE
jgi:hypothetical protein